jgi:LPXTG-motif cell wall-anchored protein
MKNVYLLIAAPVLLATLGFGQTPTPSSTPDPASIKGCLGGSENNYTVAQDGTTQTFRITSSTVDLKPHLGHDVEIIGQTTNVAPSSGPADNTVSATGVNMIADHCAAVAASAPAVADPAPAAAASAPAVADPTPTAAATTPATTDPAPAATASTPVVVDPAPAAAASTPVVVDPTPTPAPAAAVSAPVVADPPATASAPMTASAAPESTDSLPATGSSLPLIGLAGLGLVGMGLLIRRVRTN